jgi:hypothetical protein
MNLTSLLRRCILSRVLRRRARLTPAARERIRRALWREITRREWADFRYDARQDNGKGYEMGWFDGALEGLSSGSPDGLAAGVRQHRTLVGLIGARRRGGKLDD